jgi:muramoyltetrapeptide carboxypeptidase
MNTKLKLWQGLKPGDSIEIIAPASGTTEDKLETGLNWIRSLGLHPRVPERLIQTELFFAAPLKQQLDQLKSALHSDAKAIWCLRGGYGSMRLIPLLEKISPPKEPKLLIGFSDITALHLYLNQKWRWPTLHGRTISQLKTQWSSSDEEQIYRDLLLGHKKEICFNQLEPLNSAALKKKIIQAPITGGNFRIVQSSLGTKWSIKTKDRIVFLEDVSERGYSVDRMFEQLYQARIFDQNVKALILGDFTDGLEKNGQDLVPQAIERFAQRVKFPVLRGLPCGHGKELNYPLPFYTPAVLKTGVTASLTCSLVK